MEQNKQYAVLRRGEWWSVVDCGPTKTGGMSIDIWSNHIKKDGRTYRYISKLFMPPDNLVEWQEIETLQKMLTVVESPGNVLEGWEDKEDEGYAVFSRFSALIGHPMTVQEVKQAIENAT